MGRITPLDRALMLLGKTMDEAAARLCVDKSTISNWRARRRKPDPLTALLIEKLTKGMVRREDIRPDIDWSVYE